MLRIFALFWIARAAAAAGRRRDLDAVKRIVAAA